MKKWKMLTSEEKRGKGNFRGKIINLETIKTI